MLLSYDIFCDAFTFCSRSELIKLRLVCRQFNRLTLAHFSRKPYFVINDVYYDASRPDNLVIVYSLPNNQFVTAYQRHLNFEKHISVIYQSTTRAYSVRLKLKPNKRNWFDTLKNLHEMRHVWTDNALNIFVAKMDDDYEYGEDNTYASFLHLLFSLNSMFRCNSLGLNFQVYLILVQNFNLGESLNWRQHAISIKNAIKLHSLYARNFFCFVLSIERRKGLAVRFFKPRLGLDFNHITEMEFAAH